MDWDSIGTVEYIKTASNIRGVTGRHVCVKSNLKCCQHSRYADKDDCIITKAAAQLRESTKQNQVKHTQATHNMVDAFQENR